MRHSRYQQPRQGNHDQEQLPLDTNCTILTRQSTLEQLTRNTFSAEVDPRDLVAAAQRLGFPSDRVCIVDADMGIGAYSTTIDERPGLKHWLYELLPSGKSRVLLVSQEDRLFRDKWETEHNQFIRQVANYGGWVICGQRVYNFRREMDCEQFRLACKYGRQYIEHHIKGRLHPATQRAAMAGRYVGGRVPMGYVVDYNPHSPTYKYLIVYEAHAVLVGDVFKYFAALPQRFSMAVARHWEQEGLYWPFYGPEVDPRVVRAGEAGRRRDEVLGGYRLGWRVRAGEIAWDGGANVPRICHPPLVESELFWWCYDRLVAERPSWAPPRPALVSAPVARPRRPKGGCARAPAFPDARTHPLCGPRDCVVGTQNGKAHMAAM
jgi:DNA invertase Pin-like site-specific DNA recombinase